VDEEDGVDCDGDGNGNASVTLGYDCDFEGRRWPIDMPK
jgi:hypothetical protein